MPDKSDQPSPSPPRIPLERLPDNLLLEPIEYIFADHCRQRDMCAVLKAFAKGGGADGDDAEAAQAILYCLKHDLALHIADEEQDLFPRIRARAKPEDKFDDTLHLMSAEHVRDRELADGVISGLTQLAQGEPIKNLHSFRAAAELLSEVHLSHLNWENNVVLELARLRLNADDQRAMAKSMAARRGIKLPQMD